MDCGYPEISSEQCTNRGCCFDSSIHGVPWCFKPLQDTGKPSRAHSILPGSPEAMHTPAGPPSTVAVRQLSPSEELRPGTSAAGGCPLLSLC